MQQPLLSDRFKNYWKFLSQITIFGAPFLHKLHLIMIFEINFLFVLKVITEKKSEVLLQVSRS